jgi:hypothetical protein
MSEVNVCGRLWTWIYPHGHLWYIPAGVGVHVEGGLKRGEVGREGMWQGSALAAIRSLRVGEGWGGAVSLQQGVLCCWRRDPALVVGPPAGEVGRKVR